jgi:hypothetical protein
MPFFAGTAVFYQVEEDPARGPAAMASPGQHATLALHGQRLSQHITTARFAQHAEHLPQE